MIPELQELVISYCQNFEDVLIFLSYHKHLNKDLIKLPKSYQLPLIYQCAKKGYYLSVRYLYSIGKGCNTTVIDIAGASGHLEIVKFLYTVGKKSTKAGIVAACINGYLDVVKYLYSVSDDFPDLINFCIYTNVSTEIVEFLKSVKTL